MTNLVPVGRALARQALKRLAGEPGETVTVAAAEHAPLVFDARQLERWGIPESRLPAGSTVLYRQPSLWRDYRGTVLAALTVGVAQALLLAFALFERRRRSSAQAALARSYAQLQDLSGRVVTAQEEERTRIARDLHDDIGQRLASLSIALSGAKRRVPETEPVLREELSALQIQTTGLSSDLRRLSHDLHPGALEHLGLVAALRGRCAEIRGEAGIDVRLDVAGEWAELPSVVGLCLYRVAQEALRNVARHAQARSAVVSLEREESRVVMRVRDDGRGFEPVADRPSGLGLVSLGERVRMLGGALDLQTSSLGGTTLTVSLPVGESHAA
jgi:signal transduction histidine kinase